jgi:hypothetical protein
MHVILSEQSESKDLRIYGTAAVELVRGSFDFGLRPSPRMTTLFSQEKPPFRAAFVIFRR